MIIKYLRFTKPKLSKITTTKDFRSTAGVPNLLRPPWHQMRPPTGTYVPKSTLLWDFSCPPGGTSPPGWETQLYGAEGPR